MHDPDFMRWCLLSVIEGAPHEANAA
jgi:hypothetical protein